MDNKFSVFYFKAWHFALLIILFFVLTCIISENKVQKMPTLEKANNLAEWPDSISNEGVHFVLFYERNSDACKKVRYNLNLLAEQTSTNVTFLEIDIDNYPEYCEKYNISGIPNVLIFKNCTECGRIMGIVSLENMMLICNRYIGKCVE